MIVFPNAKINIGLHVVSKRPNGYHNLETVFYPVQVFDALEMAETGKTGITFSGLPVGGPPEENLVVKAYHILKKDFELPPVQFHLHKSIPVGAGLGGGSADAAFALKMLNSYFKLQITGEKLKNYATKLGADCPFFIDNKSAFAEGIGDLLSYTNIDLSEFQIIILKPEVSVSTTQAYRNVNPAPSVFKLKNLSAIPIDRWKDVVKNDFEESVFLRYPEIKKWKEKLYEMGAVYASMSGSGSAVFGLFRHLPTDFRNKIPKSILLNR
jgi:4-diphosphocytidyl-2-C-methyl-D-erythritol kinase